MLKGIPSILQPELLKVLAEMGHGDEIVIGDGNFPAASMGKRCIRCDGHDVPKLLDAILRVLPLDTYVDAPVSLMQVTPGDPVGEPPVWKTFAEIIERREPGTKIQQIERFAFYERAKNAYATIQTGETALYANILLKKGVVKE